MPQACAQLSMSRAVGKPSTELRVISSKLRKEFSTHTTIGVRYNSAKRSSTAETAIRPPSAARRGADARESVMVLLLSFLEPLKGRVGQDDQQQRQQKHHPPRRATPHLS